MTDGLSLGLDIGGAHLKAVWADAQGHLIEVVQIPVPLWLGLSHLHEAMERLLSGRPAPARVAVTMTGELADLFESRAQGVADILDAVEADLPSGTIRVYCGHLGLLELDEARGHAHEIASANWLATAQLAASSIASDGILMDIGSTTTDIVPFRHGGPHHTGYDDGERLESGELVYTGVVRTPVMAVARQAPFDGAWRRIVAEVFATMADVHRLTGELPDGVDQQPTADRRDHSPEASRRRLARMVGEDAADADPAAWKRLAVYLAECQIRIIEDALAQVCSRGGIDERAPLVAAGAGRFLVRRVADRVGRPWQDVFDGLKLPGHLREAANQCAPATAMALYPSARR